ncbi:hypothetical protein P7K49_031329, partial [Saguinus oedipus]
SRPLPPPRSQRTLWTPRPPSPARAYPQEAHGARRGRRGPRARGCRALGSSYAASASFSARPRPPGGSGPLCSAPPPPPPPARALLGSGPGSDRGVVGACGAPGALRGARAFPPVAPLRGGLARAARASRAAGAAGTWGRPARGPGGGGRGRGLRCGRRGAASRHGSPARGGSTPSLRAAVTARRAPSPPPPAPPGAREATCAPPSGMSRGLVPVPGAAPAPSPGAAPALSPAPRGAEK